jgi:hypothetical protein
MLGLFFDSCSSTLGDQGVRGCLPVHLCPLRTLPPMLLLIGQCETQVFRASMVHAGGLLGAVLDCGLLAPREVVLQQRWALREADGVFEIAFRSVEHPAAPVAKRTWSNSWTAPVRAEV